MKKRVLKKILIVFLMLVFWQSWSEKVVDVPKIVVQTSRLDSVLDETLFESILGGVDVNGRHVSDYDRNREAVVKMVDGLNTSKNYREFHEVALKNPEGGGIFYAANIISMCSAVKNETEFGQEVQTPYTSDMNSETYRKISEAAEGLRSKCSAFIPQELSQDHVHKISRFEASNKDPLATLSKALGEVGFKNIEKRRRLVNEVVRLGDPLLASELGMRLAIAPHPETGSPIFMFGGKIYPLDSKVDVGHALYMLPCSMGLKCDKDDFDIALMCASNAGCYEGRVDYVREMMAAGSRDFDGTMRLHEEMAEAVRARDLTKFLN